MSTNALSGLPALIEALHSYPASGAAVLTVATLGGLAWLMSKHGGPLLNAISKRREFQTAVPIFDAINEQLTEIKVLTGAVRCGVWQFSNGQKDLSGIPFLSARVTFLRCAAGVSVPVEMMRERTPLNVLEDHLRLCWPHGKQGQGGILLPKEIRHPIMRAIYAENAVSKAAMVPLISPSGGPVGILSIGFMGEAKMTDNEIKHLLSNKSIVISGCLSKMKRR